MKGGVLSEEERRKAVERRVHALLLKFRYAARDQVPVECEWMEAHD